MNRVALSKFRRNSLFKVKSYIKPQGRVSYISLRKYYPSKSVSIKPSIYKPVTHNNLMILCGLNQRRYLTTPPTRYNTEDRNLLDHNEKRSNEHRDEIKNNEYPNLNSAIHPNVDDRFKEIDDIDDEDHVEYYVDKSRPKFEDYVLPHPIWTKEELTSIKITHKKPEKTVDYLAYLTVGLMRFTWDLSTGYLLGRKLRLFRFSHRMWLLRIVFLETVAGGKFIFIFRSLF